MLKKVTLIFGVLAISSLFGYSYVTYSQKPITNSNLYSFSNLKKEDLTLPEDLNTQKTLHVSKPENVKGVYISSWVAGTKSIRDKITNLINTTEINSIVIDFKDSTGVVSIPAKETDSPDRIKSASKRAADLASYIEELHKDNIYVIARIAVFEDPIYSKNHPNEAVQRKDGSVWADKHGLSWVDASSTNFHKYILALALEAYDLGFDEINLDYVRYPTDGSRDKVFPLSTNGVDHNVITNFIKYIHTDLKEKNIPLSIDVFGQIVSTADDMGIGQYYEDLLGATDTIAPMVYPSHFYPGYKNLKSPEGNPGETIRLSMIDAIARRTAINSTTEIRPWLQDFSLAISYDASMVRAQIDAAENLGIKSFLLWDPKNRYTKEALKLESSN